MAKQKIQEWKEKVDAEVLADAKKDDQVEADRIAPEVYDGPDRQQAAWEWVSVRGFSQEITALQMKISQARVSQLLNGYFKRYPVLRPVKASWLMGKGWLPPPPKQPPKPGETGSDAKDAGGIFGESGHGYHKPGKVSYPSEDKGQRRRELYRKKN